MARKTEARVDCKCGAAGTPQRMTIKGTVYGFPCICTASQDPAAEACWACERGFHRRTRL